MSFLFSQPCVIRKRAELVYTMWPLALSQNPALRTITIESERVIAAGPAAPTSEIEIFKGSI